MSWRKFKIWSFRITNLVILMTVFFSGLGAGYLAKTVSSLYMKSKKFSARKLAAIDNLTLRVAVQEKFNTYEELIQLYSLSHGMVVTKDRAGAILHRCDSLLFSALRYVALQKIGEIEKAAVAWESIQNSYIDGRWRRHPLCADQALSRDMFLGLLIALSAEPPGGKAVLQGIIRQIDKGLGFFDDGPFYVSYLSPQMAELIRLLAFKYDIPQKSLPLVVRYGFSTLDMNSMELRRGYQSHLLALGLWLELELIEQSLEFEDPKLVQSRSPIAFVLGANQEAQPDHLYLWHWEFIAEKLYRLDEENLFYRYLYLRSQRTLDQQTLLALGHELLQMPAFPNGFLPMDCDRRADYLWQRDSQEAKARHPRCRLIYPGVDYLWMAALILEDLE